MPLTNREINLVQTSSAYCVIINSTSARTFAITDIKLYVPVITLSTQDNAKLLQKSKSALKRTINWNKYQPKITIQRQNQYLDYLIDPRFQRVNRCFVLSFENNSVRAAHTEYFLLKVKIKDYNVMIHGKKTF